MFGHLLDWNVVAGEQRGGAASGQDFNIAFLQARTKSSAPLLETIRARRMGVLT
jgi:hypothetical protein